jgi:hypothetical protein
MECPVSLRVLRFFPVINMLHIHSGEGTVRPIRGRSSTETWCHSTIAIKIIIPSRWLVYLPSSLIVTEGTVTVRTVLVMRPPLSTWATRLFIWTGTLTLTRLNSYFVSKWMLLRPTFQIDWAICIPAGLHFPPVCWLAIRHHCTVYCVVLLYWQHLPFLWDSFETREFQCVRWLPFLSS